MNLLVFDGRTGASGDMLLGALVAAGADPAVLDPLDDALDVTFDIRDVDKNGITATRVTIRHIQETQRGKSEGHDNRLDDEHNHNDERSHDHDHDHEHCHDHNHNHHHSEAEGHGPHRTFPDVVDILSNLDISPSVAEDARAVFQLLGEAEATVHGTDLETTHFHEVGADDAIADIVGASLLFDDLDPDRILTTPVALGGGEVTMSHGRYPVPPPAVTEILARAEYQTYGGPVETELLTPTGAAVLAHFADGVDRLPPMRFEQSGYGAGAKDLPERANVLRAIRGEATDTGRLKKDDIVVLETNVDDVPPEILGSLHDTLQDVGARDVSIVPLTMKKSRPGHLIKVITKEADADRVAGKLAEETGTLGIREAGVSHRWIANREFEEVLLEYEGDTYEVIVKIASDTDGNVYDVSAEYDDALEVAESAGVPVREVMGRAEAAVDRD